MEFVFGFIMGVGVLAAILYLSIKALE